MPERDATIIMGIDPGKTGGVAVVSFEKRAMQLLTAQRMPIRNNIIDVNGLDEIYCKFKPEAVVIEEQWIHPGDGKRSAATAMKLYGMLLGWCNLRHGSPVIIPAVKWKRDCGLTGNKELSRKEATRLFPASAESWQFKKDDGVAEAALLARYAGLSAVPAAGG